MYIYFKRIYAIILSGYHPQQLVTFVTGGASGLGKATVQRFAQKGSQVVFCDLPTSNGHDVAKELGDNVSFVPADITNETDVRGAISHIDAKHGRLDVLVNCAGRANANLTYNFHKDRARTQKDFETVLKVQRVNGCFFVFFFIGTAVLLNIGQTAGLPSSID